jgi:tRNA (cmo5U34)-methyltransferase
MSSIDNLFQTPQPPKAFRFDNAVAKVFDDMINRSIPGYATLLQLISTIADQHIQAHSAVYDLGCSLGTVTRVMQQSTPATPVQFYGVDTSQPMLDKAAQNFSAANIHWINADINELRFQPCSLILLNFCLQFIPLADRDGLLQRCYQALLPGGVLILSEKIAYEETDTQNWMRQQHETFKQMQGYSELEISQKRQALENVLIAETLAQHQARLQQAGFLSSQMFFQSFNFMSLIAIKVAAEKS